MACQTCIKSQRWMVKVLCSAGLTAICLKAKERLAKLEGKK